MSEKQAVRVTFTFPGTERRVAVVVPGAIACSSEPAVTHTDVPQFIMIDGPRSLHCGSLTSALFKVEGRR